jgi:hypothetical protein
MARSSYDPLTEQVDLITVARVGSILSTFLILSLALFLFNLFLMLIFKTWISNVYVDYILCIYIMHTITLL